METVQDNHIVLEDIVKEYEDGGVIAVDSLDLEVKKGEFVTLLGPSGSGKTTTLMIVAGFVEQTSGRVIIGGKDTSLTPPYKRDIGMVFQHYALFPHMTVFENIAFPLKMRDFSEEEIEQRVGRALELVQLPNYGSRSPNELSGGQQQRVAVARALVFEPLVMLMDEPLGALDKKLRESMQLELKSLHDELNITVLYVTHDQEEALTMSTRIAVLNSGKLAQIGSPTKLYEEPENVFVADFIGESNLVKGKVKARKGDLYEISFGEDMQIVAKNSHSNHSVGERVHLHIRPERVHLCEEGSEFKNALEGEVKEVIYLGDITRLHVGLGEGTTIAVKHQNARGPLDVTKGDSVQVGWMVDNTKILGD